MAASMVEVKNYFEYTSTTDFARDWRELSEEEKTFFKEEVGKEIGK
jgi:hypothetical protein